MHNIDWCALDVRETASPCPLDPFFTENFKFYQIQIKGKAFLHNQVNYFFSANFDITPSPLV